MTNREFLNAMKSMLICDEREITFTADELIAKADEMINAIDSKNEKRKSAESKEKKAVLERIERVVFVFESNPNVLLTREELADMAEVSCGQATSYATTLVKQGMITKEEVKDGKSRKVAYKYVVE